MLGGVLAVALVCAGILALQLLVPAESDPDAGGPGPAVVGPPSSSAAGTAPPSTPAGSGPASTAPPVSPTPAAARPTLTVLNNSKVNKLAAKAAADFTRGGWVVTATGNLGGRLAVTTVYYGPGQEAAAAALRRQFPAIAAAAPRTADVPGAGGLTVVVTRDYPH
jgi:hypothetical protein